MNRWIAESLRNTLRFSTTTEEDEEDGERWCVGRCLLLRAAFLATAVAWPSSHSDAALSLSHVWRYDSPFTAHLSSG